MKPVGFLKKGSKTWAITQDATTGFFNTGYTGYTIIGTAEYIQGRVDEAKKGLAELIAKHGTRPAVSPYPSGIYSYHDKSCPPELKAKYDEYHRTSSINNLWDRYEREANTIVYDRHPIFEEELFFTGYSKGRSSFTLNFCTAEGEKISFGPKFTGELVDALIQGGVQIVDLTETERVVNGEPVHDPVAGRWTYPKIKVKAGVKGIKARFCFIKQGQNIYAQLTDEVGV